jgi:hypothetical protein
VNALRQEGTRLKEKDDLLSIILFCSSALTPNLGSPSYMQIDCRCLFNNPELLVRRIRASASR